MDAECELALRDAIGDAFMTFQGVSQALGYVSDVSTDHDMAQMLSNTIEAELGRLRKALPESWSEDRI